MHRALATANRALERESLGKAHLQLDVRWLNQQLQSQDEEIGTHCLAYYTSGLS